MLIKIHNLSLTQNGEDLVYGVTFDLESIEKLHQTS